MTPTENVSKGTNLILTIVIAGLVGMVMGGVTAYFSQHVYTARVALTTPYQAVLLNNGSAYFGKIEGLGTPYPLLKEVYYIQSRQNPENKQVMNILVKRGNELHGPDRMILNANDIVFVEPVSPSSRVAQLIAEQKNK
jgi:hypothetical protein